MVTLLPLPFQLTINFVENVVLSTWAPLYYTIKPIGRGAKTEIVGDLIK